MIGLCYFQAYSTQTQNTTTPFKKHTSQSTQHTHVSDCYSWGQSTQNGIESKQQIIITPHVYIQIVIHIIYLFE